MAENMDMNVELNDELMKYATGGVAEDKSKGPEFNVGDKVWYNNEKWKLIFGLGTVTEVRDLDYMYVYHVHWEKYNPGDNPSYRQDQLTHA